MEQFLSKFRELMDEFTKDGRRVFVFIDDLDRCLPESALEIFESIKLFLDAPGCGYVVALDREVIRKGLDIKYARQREAGQEQVLIDPDEYIEKTISVSFDLPQLSRDDAYELLNGFTLPITLEDHHKRLIVGGLGTNPRRIKRFMNTLAVQLHLAEVAMKSGLAVDACLLPGGKPEHFQYFLKLLLIAYRYSGVFARVLEDAGLLGRLQRISNAFEDAIKAEPPATARGKRKQALEGEQPLVASLHDTEEFWQLLAEKPDLLQDTAVIAKLRNWFRYRGPLNPVAEQNH